MAKPDPVESQQQATPPPPESDGAVAALSARVEALEMQLASRDAALVAAHQCWERAADWIARLNARLTKAELSGGKRLSVRLDEVPEYSNTTVETYNVVYTLTKQALNGPTEPSS